MKKSLTVILFLMIMNAAFAQDVYNALSFSQNFYNLTARSSAIGGASGALKSDLGSIVINPAAIATYKTCELSFTPEFYSVLSKSDYQSTVTSKYRDDFNISSVGLVYSFQSKKSPTRYNVGFSYNKVNSFNIRNIVQGTSAIEGASYWDQLAKQPAAVSPEFDVWRKVNTKPGSNPSSTTKYLFADKPGTETGATPAVSGDVKQLVNSSTTGNIGEYSLSFGVNLSEIVYVGVSAVVRDASSVFISLLDEESITDSDYRYAHEQRSEVKGVGFSGNFGLLIYPIPALTIGISVRLPTFYSLKQYDDEKVLLRQPLDLYDGNANYIPNGKRVEYNLTSPLQASLNVGYEFSNLATVTFDYLMTPYSMTKFANSNGATNIIDATNTFLENDSKFGSALRLGAEFYVWRGITARLGGGYASAVNSSIKPTANLGVGAGYSFGDAVIDFAYVYQYGQYEYNLYDYSARVKSTIAKNFFTLSLAYRF
jgi:hypothetical protein